MIEIHTSDRIGFKRCRRKWDFSSPLRRNLVPDTGTAAIAPLWFGTGVHFALQDFHGFRKYQSAQEAFEAYTKAFSEAERPENFEDLVPMGIAMLKYYEEHWLRNRRDFKTAEEHGDPLVEVEFQIPLFNDVVYAGTFDRIVLDAYGRKWIGEYKTAARFDTAKLDTDPQVTSYVMAANKMFTDEEIQGVLYMQFLKKAPEPPQALKSGGLSVNKNQITSHALYKQALEELYGSVDRAPSANYSFLAYLATLETPDGDKFVRRDIVRRNAYQCQREFDKIIQEAQDMLNPDLPLYPNPTRDCAWDCPFKSVCLAMDDGSDWEYLLQAGFKERVEERDDWKKKLGYEGGKDYAGEDNGDFSFFF